MSGTKTSHGGDGCLNTGLDASLCRYSTSAAVSVSDALIQDFYSREANTAILLTVDTAFTSEKLKLKAFVSTPVQLGDKQLAAQFHEIQLDLRLVEAERVGCEWRMQTCSLLV